MFRLIQRSVLLAALSIVALLTITSIARGLTISTSAQTTVATVSRITLTDSLIANPFEGDITLTMSIARTSGTALPLTIGHVTAGTFNLLGAGVTGSIITTTPWPIVVTRLVIAGAAYGVSLQGVAIRLIGTPLTPLIYRGSIPTLLLVPPATTLSISPATLTSDITTGALSGGSVFSLSPALPISSNP